MLAQPDVYEYAPEEATALRSDQSETRLGLHSRAYLGVQTLMRSCTCIMLKVGGLGLHAAHATIATSEH